MASASSLADRIRTLHAAAAALWREYQANGPGRVDAARFDAVEAAAQPLQVALPDAAVSSCLGEAVADPTQWLAELRDSAARLHDLSRRCACTRIGLCFVTGEAGLIPRRDQHQAFEEALERLATKISQLAP